MRTAKAIVLRHPQPLRGVVVAAGLSLGMVAGCLRIDAYHCVRNDECVLDGVEGRCLIAEAVCVYEDPASCSETRWIRADGSCAPNPGGGIDSAEGSSGATSTADASSTDDGVPPESSTTDPVETSGDPFPPTTGQPTGCAGTTEDITGQGVVVANSVFSDDFPAFLGVDGNFATSWFSAGPEPDGLPTVFTWTSLETLCIAQVQVTGNGLHANPSFRTDFGFENMTLRVYDETDAVVFQQMYGLEGTPDPPVVAFPDVEGVRVELELFNHESNNCGGFSELSIVGN
ncbi:MAG: hypothetical protein AB1Z98_37245 [Nannocystaceae bacterium]